MTAGEEMKKVVMKKKPAENVADLARNSIQCRSMLSEIVVDEVLCVPYPTRDLGGNTPASDFFKLFISGNYFHRTTSIALHNLDTKTTKNSGQLLRKFNIFQPKHS